MQMRGRSTCEAGGSIQPGVERGFASETPGSIQQQWRQPVKRATAQTIRDAVADCRRLESLFNLLS
jgi:hypothetical protein